MVVWRGTGCSLRGQSTPLLPSGRPRSRRTASLVSLGKVYAEMEKGSRGQGALSGRLPGRPDGKPERARRSRKKATSHVYLKSSLQALCIICYHAYPRLFFLVVSPSSAAVPSPLPAPVTTLPSTVFLSFPPSFAVLSLPAFNLMGPKSA